MSNKSKSGRIVKNTMMLYIRMLLLAGVSVYTIRVVLIELGVVDYGIYSVVGGVVALFSFLPGAMASASQRYFAFALGKDDSQLLDNVFTANWIIYAVVAVFAVILLETAGLWFIESQLTLPSERVLPAITLYHYSVFAFAAGIITSPLMAIIIAHEDMGLYAGLSIIESVLKLAIVFLLPFIDYDKLITYGILVLSVSILNMGMYIYISAKRYPNYRFRIAGFDKKLIREMVDFTWWTLFGQLTTVIRTHGVTILLNQMFNPVVVAAKAIAVSVASQANMFSRNFNTSLYPPIIKAYASDSRDEMFRLIYGGSKLTFYLMWIVALPLFLSMDGVLTFWLVNPPLGAVLFTKLALLEAVIVSISTPLMTAARAPGKMARYELTLGVMQIAILPMAWIALKLGGEAATVFYIGILVNTIMLFMRLRLVNELIGLPIKEYLVSVLVPILKVSIISYSISILFQYWIGDDFVGSILVILFSGIVGGITVYNLGLDDQWKMRIKNALTSAIHRIPVFR